MTKLAIISTYNENCGNASYTHALKVAFEKYVDVDVLPLDLFLLQASSKILVEAGDRHIKEMCEKIKEYDFVNIQFEAGLYGARIKDIFRRVKWLINAAPNLTLTMHRVDTDLVPLVTSISIGLKTASYKNYRKSVGSGAYTRLTKNIIEHCKNASTKKMYG